MSDPRHPNRLINIEDKELRWHFQDGAIMEVHKDGSLWMGYEGRPLMMNCGCEKKGWNGFFAHAPRGYKYERKALAAVLREAATRLERDEEYYWPERVS